MDILIVTHTHTQIHTHTSGVILLMVGTSYPALMKLEVYCSS